MLLDLIHNLIAGLKLLTFMPARVSDFRISLLQCLLLAAVTSGVFLIEDRLHAEEAVTFIWWNLPQPGWIALCTIACISITALVQDAGPLRLLTVVAALFPWALLLLFGLNDVFGSRWPQYQQASQAATHLLIILALVRATIFTANRRAVRASAVAVSLYVGVLLSSLFLQLDPRLWGVADAEPSDAPSERAAASNDESLMYAQSQLLKQQADALAPERPGVTDLYYVGFAGNGGQEIFAREVLFAEAALARQFDLQGHVAELINDEQSVSERPLATYEALKQTLKNVSERMNVDEDVLFLFLSSHGSQEHELSVEFAGWPLRQITPADLSEALDASGIRWRVIVISACYSGGFLDTLRNDNSLIITAAASDRSSFGCSDENDLTYFGDAFFRQGMAAQSNFTAAFELAKHAIEKQEIAEHLTPSLPQLSSGAAIERKLKELRSSTMNR